MTKDSPHSADTSVVFVTGATGLVGAHLLYDLLLKGYYVKALKRPNSNVFQVRKIFSLYTDDVDSLFRQIEWIDGDLLDYKSMSDIIWGCSQVYHAAAVVSFNHTEKAEMMLINVGGTANIVNVCLDRQIPLCHVSSIGALGRGDGDSLITENDLWQSSVERSAYSCSKYKGEMEVWRGIAEGLQATIVNPAVILGPGDWTKSSLKFFPNVYKGMRFHTPGITAFVDVRDVTRCMLQLMEQKCFGERYILSSGELSYRELFNRIADGLHVKRPSVTAQPWMLNIGWRLSWLFEKLTGKNPALTKETAHSAFQQIRFSNEKITKTLGYKFLSLEECVSDCCRFFLEDQNLSGKNI